MATDPKLLAAVLQAFGNGQNMAQPAAISQGIDPGIMFTPQARGAPTPDPGIMYAPQQSAGPRYADPGIMRAQSAGGLVSQYRDQEFLRRLTQAIHGGQ